MSYRITLNRPPVVECDTPEEVIALAEIAMQRVTAVEFTDQSDDGAPDDNESQQAERKRIELPATTIQPRLTDAKTATPKQAAKSITAYLRQKGKAARVSELCRELGLVEASVRDALAGPEFLELGKGFFRLADGEPPADREPSQPKRRGRPPKVKPEAAEPEPDPDDFEDPEPPRRKPISIKQRPAVPQPVDLAERIRRVLAKDGALGIVAIASLVDQPPTLVKDVLRSRGDLFRLHPRAGGWELVA